MGTACYGMCFCTAFISFLYTLVGFFSYAVRNVYYIPFLSEWAKVAHNFDFIAPYLSSWRIINFLEGWVLNPVLYWGP